MTRRSLLQLFHFDSGKKKPVDEWQSLLLGEEGRCMAWESWSEGEREGACKAEERAGECSQQSS